MPEVKYTLYDTAVFGVTANTEFLLFQVRQGADATHTENFTNSRGPGVMPQSEKFVIQQIDIFPDFKVLEANSMTWFLASVFEIKLADKSLLKVPMAMCLGENNWTGSDASTAAADQAHVGLMNGGYPLADKPIELAAGEVFVVRVLQGTAAAASSNVKVALTGLLTFPG